MSLAIKSAPDVKPQEHAAPELGNDADAIRQLLTAFPNVGRDEIIVIHQEVCPARNGALCSCRPILKSAVYSFPTIKYFNGEQ
jgi:hypothetical protein